MSYLKENSEQNFCNFFDTKGIVGSVAEKALHNYTSKAYDNGIELFERLHYFAVGHTFKQLHTDVYFKYQINEQKKINSPTDYLSLQIEGFANLTKTKCLTILLDNIRNIFSHFLHDFEYIKTTNINAAVIEFLKESFWLAATQSLLKAEISTVEKEKPLLSSEDIKNILHTIVKNDYKVIQFLKEIFYQSLYKPEKQLKDPQKKKKEWLDANLKTKNEWLNWILFTDVQQDFEWQLNINGSNMDGDHQHNMLKITSGKYLSFTSCLFLLTMFLYKSEAGQLIPKIKGFKKNGTPQDRNKIELFTFFAKKFKSQDINSEERNLVNFRDIILYLNKYPTAWNRQLNEAGNIIIKDLKEDIIDNEIKRCFPEVCENPDFKEYILERIFHNKDIQPKKEIYHSIAYSDDEVRKSYISIENNSINNKEYSQANFKTFALQYVIEEFYINRQDLKKYLNICFSDEDFAKHNQRLGINKRTLKLKQRVDKNLLYTSYGRNNDRFMEYSVRYLAEIDFFGSSAQFKMYQYYAPQEQAEMIPRIKNKLSKKEYDKLKFHDGKLIHFSTYKEHIKHNPEWDLPFVVQNNAVYLKIDGYGRTICIQRAALVYLLEIALYSSKPNSFGYDILSNYCKKKDTEEATARQEIISGNSISESTKREFKKIVPSNFLQYYYPTNNSQQPEKNACEKLLLEALDREKLYKKAYNQAKVDGSLEYFEKRNKGKNYKLRFIRKACNWMFFKDLYGAKVAEQNAHHKQFHISKEEFNDFSKWMYAFGESPLYKKFLRDLFTLKGFFANNEFKQLFESCNSLNDMYCKTKALFEHWVKTNPLPQRAAGKYNADNYNRDIFGKTDFFINLSHFIAYLKQRQLMEDKNGRIIYRSLVNTEKLISKYYLQRSDADKKNIKLFNALYQNRLEDCLLYEIAIRYADIQEDGRTNIRKILNQNINVPIKPHRNSVSGFVPYSVIVPFKDIDKFKQLEQLNKKMADKNINHSILYNLPRYYPTVQHQKELQSVTFQNGSISMAAINTINLHLITTSVKFIKILFALEKYFIWKEKLTLANVSNPKNKERNRLEVIDIPGLMPYLGVDGLQNRNQALHFNLPLGMHYLILCKNIEREFIKKELPKSAVNFSSYNNMQTEVLTVFLKQ